MNGTDENKVDSLIAELRSFGDRPPPRFAWKRIADELESAVKEERKLWQHLQDTTVKMLEYEKAEANRRVAEIAAQSPAKMLEGATIIGNRGQGNAEAMRESLIEIEKMAHCDLCNVYSKYRNKFNNLVGGIERIARAALSAPPRQCDVGTAEEQERRYKAIGEVYHTLTLKNALACSQTPYDEGGEK